MHFQCPSMSWCTRDLLVLRGRCNDLVASFTRQLNIRYGRSHPGPVLDFLRSPSPYHEFAPHMDVPGFESIEQDAIPWQDTYQNPPQYIRNPEKALRNPAGTFWWSLGFNRPYLKSEAGSSIGTMIPLNQLHERPIHDQPAIGESQANLKSPFIPMTAVSFGEGQTSRQTEHSISGFKQGFQGSNMNIADTATFSTKIQDANSEMSRVKRKPLISPRPSFPRQDRHVDIKRRQRGIV